MVVLMERHLVLLVIRNQTTNHVCKDVARNQVALMLSTEKEKGAIPSHTIVVIQVVV